MRGSWTALKNLELLKALDNMCSTLSDAINRGNEQFASDLARQLATCKAPVRVKLEEPEKDEFSMLTKDNKIQ